jgi:hypothetical protein
MKHIAYILFLVLPFLSLGQETSVTQNEIEKYVKSIDKIRKENKLMEITYQDMSSCGGWLRGYYQNNKLVFIDSKYSAELGYSSKTYYIKNDQTLKVVYKQHYAEWAKYEENYPPDKYDWDDSKMTYTDTVYSILLSNPIIFHKKSNNKFIDNNPDNALIDELIKCGTEMKFELQEVINQVDSLKYVVEMPFICPTGIEDNKMSSGCGDDFFWNVVSLKQNVIELLIDKLDDTTVTQSFVPMYGYYFTVADLAFWVLVEIVRDIPKFKLMGVKEDKSGEYASTDRPYWDFVNKGLKNRQKFKVAVKNWYHKNKDNLVWVESNIFSSCDCSGKHPNGGHYILKDKKGKQ